MENNFLVTECFCLPIVPEESLQSIVISEIDLPTEASVVFEKENTVEVEKAETFGELYEKYDAQFIKNVTDTVDDETPLQKRNSDDGEDESGKSLIEKIQKIDDPEVRKEFELEISNGGHDSEDEKVAEDGTQEYEPNYAKKIIVATEKPMEIVGKSESENSIQDFHIDDNHTLTVHEKENLQAHLVEQLVHQNDSNVEFTTIISDDSFTHHEKIKNHEIVEVLEHIVYQSNDIELKDFTTMNPLNLQIDFDPIEIIPKDRHRFRSDDVEATTVKNDKFVGFEPTEDLLEPGEETTESDKFFKDNAEDEDSQEKTVEAIVETLEFVGMYGKSIKFEGQTKADNKIEATTIETTEKIVDAATTVESVTEIVEVRTEISVNIVIGEKPSSSSESSGSKKSSEESKSSESKELVVIKVELPEKLSESSEENNAKEIDDDDKLRMIVYPQTNAEPNKLIEDLYKDTLNHEVKKKDHPDELSLPYEVTDRKFIAEDEIARHLEEKIKPETSTVGIIETLDDIGTAINDGIKLSKDFRTSIDSFRGFTDSNQTVLDTNNEAISSKNIKTHLVNIAEEMTIEENHPKTSRVSFLTISLIGFISSTVLLALYAILKKKAARINLL